MGNQSQTIRAPMATTKPEIKMDLSELSASDLSLLEQQDPFICTIPFTQLQGPSSISRTLIILKWRHHHLPR